MNKTILVLAAMCSAMAVSAQQSAIYLHGGITNYVGDMNDRYVHLPQSGKGIGLSYQHSLTDKFSLKAGVFYGSITSTDKQAAKASLVARNLSFQNNIVELSAMAEYALFAPHQSNWTPYVHAGAAFFRHNPFTIDKAGNKHFLRPLSTEGQGLPEYPDRQQYSLYEFAFPIGGGVRVAVNSRVTIAYDLTVRKTFTDFLDDISGNYPDENILRSRKGNKAVELSYRGGELPTGTATYPALNTPRGSAKNRDWYSTQMITLGFKLKNEEKTIYRFNKNQMRCPSY
jgi:opacity protein-like surface antigen